LLLSRDRAILDDQERQVVLDVSNAVAEVDRAYQVAQTAFNRRMAAKADVASTKAAYEADKAPLDLYLEAQRRIATAESQFFAALVEYALAIKNLHYAKGSLLDYNEIYLSEGAWPCKAYGDAANRQSSRWQPKALNYIFHQPPPVSIGTEPNYQLPPPVGPMGPQPGPGPMPEELPKTQPSGQPQLQPLGQPQLQQGAPPQSGGTPTSDRRSAPPSTTLRAAIPQPIVQPAREPQWPALPEQRLAEVQRPTTQAAHEAETHAPPQSNRPLQTPLPVAESARIPAQPIAPVVQPVKSPSQLPSAPAADFAKTFPMTPPATEFAKTPSHNSSPIIDASPRDRQTAGNPQASNYDSLRPQNKPASVDRWTIPAAQTPAGQTPAAQSPAPQTPTPGPVANIRDTTARSAEADEPRESIFVSSARLQNAGAASTLRPLPPVGNSNPYSVAPTTLPNNDLRPAVYPIERKANSQPWPISNESPSGLGVQKTSYSDAPSDPQRPAPKSTRPPILQPLPPVTPTEPLPRAPILQPLPPIILPTERLPPVQ
jgi:hypothetical protein